jgi:transcriptional regulator GlxA family with amidase domain
MRIYVLALNEVFDSGLTTLLDTFGMANDLAESAGTSSARFDVTIVGVGSRVYTRHGLSVPVRSSARLARPDVALVPALAATMPDTLRMALDRRDIGAAHVLLRRWSGSGALVGAACTGTFVLAAPRCSTAIVRRHHGGSPRSFVNGTRRSFSTTRE